MIARAPRHRTRAALAGTVALLTLSLLAAACGSSKGSKAARVTSPSGSTTTAPSRATEAAYTGHGPYQAGVEELALADGRRVVVWYPAAASVANQPKEIFDIASLLSPKLQSQIPAALRPNYTIDAHQGAPAAKGGPFPVVLFSHGYAGFPEQSADLTTHLAQWGFIVVAPDHVERSLDGLLGTAKASVAPSTDPAVLSKSLDLVTAENTRAGSPIKGLVDTSEAAVIGHSAGAAAAYETAGSDKRIKAFISYAVGLTGGQGKKVAPPPVPDVPGMVMTGTRDGIIPPSSSRSVYDGMHAPKYFVTIADSGHLVFSDICLIGRSQGGLVALVHRAGLDLPASLLRLANDGCTKGFADPRTAFPAIDDLSISFLRYELGVDKAPVGLAPGVTVHFTGPKVTLREQVG